MSKHTGLGSRDHSLWKVVISCFASLSYLGRFIKNARPVEQNNLVRAKYIWAINKTKPACMHVS